MQSTHGRLGGDGKMESLPGSRRMIERRGVPPVLPSAPSTPSTPSWPHVPGRESLEDGGRDPAHLCLSEVGGRKRRTC